MKKYIYLKKKRKTIFFLLGIYFILFMPSVPMALWHSIWFKIMFWSWCKYLVGIKTITWWTRDSLEIHDVVIITLDEFKHVMFLCDILYYCLNNNKLYIICYIITFGNIFETKFHEKIITQYIRTLIYNVD